MHKNSRTHAGGGWVFFLELAYFFPVTSNFFPTCKIAYK